MWLGAECNLFICTNPKFDKISVLHVVSVTDWSNWAQPRFAYNIRCYSLKSCLILGLGRTKIVSRINIMVVARTVAPHSGKPTSKVGTLFSNMK